MCGGMRDADEMLLSTELRGQRGSGDSGAGTASPSCSHPRGPSHLAAPLHHGEVNSSPPEPYESDQKWAFRRLFSPPSSFALFFRLFTCFICSGFGLRDSSSSTPSAVGFGSARLLGALLLV